MTLHPPRMLIGLLLCGLFFVCITTISADTPAGPTTLRTGESAPQTDQPGAIMPDPAYSEEEIRRARNRVSLQIFVASAVVGTIIVICIIVWAQRKRHALGKDQSAP